MKQIPLVCADWNVVSTRSEWLNNRHTDLCLLSLGKSWCESHITFRVCQRHAEALQLVNSTIFHPQTWQLQCVALKSLLYGKSVSLFGVLKYDQGFDISCSKVCILGIILSFTLAFTCTAEWVPSWAGVLA